MHRTAPDAPPASVTGKTAAPIASAAAPKSAAKGSITGGISVGGGNKSTTPTSQTSVADLLGTAALSQTPAGGATNDALAPKADMAALTQSAMVSLKGLSPPSTVHR
jgi:hypothetical protein